MQSHNLLRQKPLGIHGKRESTAGAGGRVSPPGNTYEPAISRRIRTVSTRTPFEQGVASVSFETRLNSRKKRQRRALVEARDPGHRVGTSTLLGDPCSLPLPDSTLLADNWGASGYFHGRPIPRRILSSFSPPARRRSKDAHRSEGLQSLHCLPSEQFHNVHAPFQTMARLAFLSPCCSITYARPILASP